MPGLCHRPCLGSGPIRLLAPVSHNECCDDRPGKALPRHPPPIPGLRGRPNMINSASGKALTSNTILMRYEVDRIDWQDIAPQNPTQNVAGAVVRKAFASLTSRAVRGGCAQPVACPRASPVERLRIASWERDYNTEPSHPAAVYQTPANFARTLTVQSQAAPWNWKPLRQRNCFCIDANEQQLSDIDCNCIKDRRRVMGLQPLGGRSGG